MKVIAMIASILISAGYPTYDNIISEGQRHDAKKYLNQIATLQEKFKTNCGTYTTNIAGGTINDCTGLDYQTTSPDGYYKLAASPVAGSFVQPTLALNQAYRVSVAPVAGSLRPENGMLGIDSIGAQRWDRDNSGGYGTNEFTWGK